MTRYLMACVVFSVAVAACGKPPRPVSANHPIVGVWQFQLPEGTCTETYLIRADGTTSVTSHEERSESAFEISARPDAEGFYTWTDRIVRNNGKPDCGGGTTPVGQQTTLYLRMLPSGDAMILCAERNLRTCIGPLVRMQGQSV